MMGAIETAIATFLKGASGLDLKGDKSYLLRCRLLPVAQRRHLAGLDGLAAALRRSPAPDLAREVVEAMATHESYFFRDGRPFEVLRNFVLPRLASARAATRRLRVWSAGCSTGQEAYSIAMLLREEAPRLPGWTWEIVATDMSGAVLERAATGRFSDFEARRGLSATLLLKYFRKDGESWEVVPALREAISWRRLNLLEDASGLGKFDIIFCRNVLIYFDDATKSRVAAHLAGTLSAGGFVFLGAAETLIGITDQLRSVAEHHGLYTTPVH